MEYEPRFERIEKTLETLAKSVASLATDSHNSYQNLNSTQRHLIENWRSQKNDIDALFKSNEDIGGAVKDLIASQVLMVGEMTKLASAQVKADEHIGKLAAETDDLKDKLHLLYEIVDNWIREHGSGHRNGEAKGDAPKA